jgi:cell division protein FtsN
VRRALPFVLALVLGVAAAVAVGCGGDRSNLVPQSRAQSLKQQLAQIQQDIADGSCEGLSAKVEAVLRDAEDLPGNVDKRLRSRINEGVRALRETAPADCAAGRTTETQPTDTVAPETTTQETTTQSTTTQETTTQETPTEPTPTPTNPVPTTSTPTPTTAEPTPPADNGGTPGEVPAP